MNQPAFAIAPQPATGISTALNFIRPQDRKPVFHSAALTGATPRLFFETEWHRVSIADLRPVAATLSLDRTGFAFLRHETAVTDLYDDGQVARVYIPETEALLKRIFGASKVVVFDSTRRSDRAGGAQNRDGARGPATRVHVDYTVKSGPQRVKDLLGEAEAARLAAAAARVVQVNLWRPIRGPVERSPLALADAASVRPQDLIATDQVFPERTGEIYHLAYHPAQRWYYAPRMTPDEVVLIKGWDSLDDGRARFTPHSAFDLPDSREDAPPRESIELRSLVIVE